MKLPIAAILVSLCLSFATIAQVKSARDIGIELFRDGKYEEAVKALRIHLESEKHDRVSWLYLGASYVKLKKNREAGTAFRNGSNFSSKKNKNPEVYDKSLRIISKPQAGYSEDARRNLVHGTVVVAVEFGADGKIGFIFPYRTLPDGLTENAVQKASEIRFEPAIKDGKPVTVITAIEYSFDIF